MILIHDSPMCTMYRYIERKYDEKNESLCDSNFENIINKIGKRTRKEE